MDLDMSMNSRLSPRESRLAFAKSLEELAAYVRVVEPDTVERMLVVIDVRDTVFDSAVGWMADLARKWRDDPSSIDPVDVGGKLTSSDLAVMADKLAALASQVAVTGEGRVWSGLMVAEDIGEDFFEQLDVVLELTRAPGKAEIAAHQVRKVRHKEAETLIETLHDWPPVKEDEFVLTVDVPSGPAPDHRPYLVLRVGDQEIYRRPTLYGHYAHLAHLCRQMADVYSGRIRDVVFAPGAKDTLTWDDCSGDAGIRKALRPLRKNIERAQKQKREAKKEQERLEAAARDSGDDLGGEQ